MRGVLGFCCCLALVAAAPVAGQPASPDVALQEDGDLAAALQELEEAGVEPSDEDLQRATADPAVAVRGELALRGDRVGTDPAGLQARLRLDLDWVGTRLRWRRRPDTAATVAGHLRLGGDRTRLLVGQVGFAWGYGLLWGGPGRGDGLTASAPLARWRSAALGRSGTPDERTVVGAALTLGLGRWRLAALGGRPAAGAEAAPSPRGLLRLQRTGPQWRLGLLAGAESGRRGASLGGAWSGRCWSGGCELAVVGEDSVAAAGAAQVHWGWRGSGGWRTELLLTAATTGTAPLAGSRPALLSTWDGSGWAWRCSWAPGGGRSLRLLVGRGRSRRAPGEPLRLRGDHLDLSGAAPLGGGVTVRARWRVRTTVTTRWSERYPWLPGVEDAADVRTLQEAALAGRRGPARGQLLVRRLLESRAAGIRHRWLAALSGTVELAPNLTGRLSWTTAWGGDADLLSAVVPVRGVLLARHWGHWRSEVLLGVELGRGALRWAAAVSAREPEPADGARTVRAVWLSGRRLW